MSWGRWLWIVLLGCTTPERPRELQTAQTVPAASAPTLRVLSFNTWSVPFRDDHEELRDRTAQAVAAIDADLVALQEVWNDADAQAYGEALAARGLNHQEHMASSFPLSRASSGLLIASRFPITNARFTPFRAGATPWWPWPPDWYATKGMLEVEVQSRVGALRVVNTHLHAAYASAQAVQERVGQSLELAKHLRSQERDMPTLLLGDLNAEPSELPHQILRDLLGLKTFARSFVDYVAVLPGRARSLQAIDVQRALVESVQLNDGRHTPMSDHAGLLVTVQTIDEPTAIPHLHHDVRQQIEATLERVEHRGAIHAWLGRGVTVLFGGLLLLLLRRRKWLLVSLLAWLAIWSSYHGWLAGPENRSIASTIRDELDDV